MKDKDIYQQKAEAKLNEWKAEVDKLKTKASGSSADAKQEVRDQVAVLERKVDEGKSKLAELEKAGDEAWDGVKTRVESTFDSMKSTFNETLEKLKK